jgi:hypothetical protein
MIDNLLKKTQPSPCVSTSRMLHFATERGKWKRECDGRLTRHRIGMSRRRATATAFIAGSRSSRFSRLVVVSDYSNPVLTISRAPQWRGWESPQHTGCRRWVSVPRDSGLKALSPQKGCRDLHPLPPKARFAPVCRYRTTRPAMTARSALG